MAQQYSFGDDKQSRGSYGQNPSGYQHFGNDQRQGSYGGNYYSNPPYQQGGYPPQAQNPPYNQQSTPYQQGPSYQQYPPDQYTRPNYPPQQFQYSGPGPYPPNFSQNEPPQHAYQSSPYNNPQGGRDHPYTLILTPTSQKHVSSLTPENGLSPHYLIEYNRALIYTSRPEITIRSASGNQVATAAWHSFSPKITLEFSNSDTEITYKDNFEPKRGSIGRLYWTLTPGGRSSANIKCADRTGTAVVTIVLHDGLTTGKIEFWRQGLEREVFEEILVSAVAEIEDLRRQMDARASSVNPGVLAGTIVAQGAGA